MAQRPRSSRLEGRTARLKLAVRLKPYAFTVVSPGIAVGYRRNRSSGVWVLRAADGKGGSWTKRIALADDFESADGTHVLDFWQAQERARQLARGSDADAGRPVAVNDAVDAYERDLIARGGLVDNAQRIRRHLTPTLAGKPVALLTSRELAAWRDGLLADGLKPATAVRLSKALKAALNLAAKRDPRVLNRAAWGDGLSGLSENFVSRNPQRLSDDKVHALIAAATAIDGSFGLFVEVAAVTGARISQIARLVVSDLQADNGAPRLLMPTSRKGRGRKPGKRPVPITPELAGRLKSNRAPEELLLLRASGLPWLAEGSSAHKHLFREAAAIAGVGGSITALRHSSIIRSLLAGVPIRVVAATHDTSVAMIEVSYSSAISDFSDAVARAGLLTPADDAAAAPSGHRP